MPASLSTAAFVGRHDELKAFERAVKQAREGVPAVLLIGGEAGIGKSTLVIEGAQRAGADLVIGRCLPMAGEVIPLAPLADLLRSVRRANPEVLTDGPTLAPLRDWIAQGSAVRGPAAGEMFAPLLELVAILGAAGAVVVAFEDLHWADPLTWDLFDYLARNLVDERVVLVGTYRANEVAVSPRQRRALGEVARLPAASRLLLGGLSRDELDANIQTLIGATARANFVDEVFARGQGNPFFTAELVAAHLNGQAIPAVLSDLIASDLEGLDETSSKVVGAIAVVGGDTSHDLLLSVTEVDANALEEALRVVIDAQLVVVDRDTDAYRFRHALIGEVVYDELLPPERQRVHRRVAAALADRPPETLARADRASELAFHLDLAGEHAAAFVALLSAADAAETVAPAAALRHLERALDLWDSAGESSASANRSDRLWQTAELAGAVGNERAVELAREALRCGVPRRGAAWGHERLGRFLWGAGHIEESATEFELAETLLPDDPGPEAAQLFAGLAQAELMLGHYDTAEAKAQSVFKLLAAPQEDPLAWAMARRVLGITIDHGGDPGRGTELCRAAVEAAPNALTQALAVLYLGVALLDAGRYQDAVNEMLDAAAEARLTGLDRSFGGYLDALTSEGLFRLGRWPEAARVLDASEGAEAFPLGEIRLALAGALLASHRGEGARAAALLEQVAALPIDPFHRWFVDRTAAEVSLALGDWAAAAALAERVLSGESAPVLWQARFVTYGTVAEVEAALDARARREPVDTEGAAARLRGRIDAARNVAEARQGSEESADIAAHLAHATATVTRLNAPDVDAWAEAATRWAGLADPWWLATARIREAEAAVAVGATARAAEAIQEAQQLASGLGAVSLLNEIQAVSMRTRLSVHAPVATVLDGTAIDQLGLTPRETEVLALVATGQTNRQIGEALFVSEKTASVHVSNILRKLQVSSRVYAAAIAQRLGST